MPLRWPIIFAFTTSAPSTVNIALIRRVRKPALTTNGWLPCADRRHELLTHTQLRHHQFHTSKWTLDVIPMKMHLIHETDWLAPTPVFYDLARGVASTSIQDVLPAGEPPVFHPEGLYNFLDFGYSVLEQTPLADVRFLRHSSRLWRRADGALEVEHLPDPFDGHDEWRLSESDVIDLIRERVQTWEASLPAEQEIVLPLSGGFDSRLLLWCLRDPSRVRAYTYGLSEDQSRSTEVVHAQALAERFGVRWERIPLGDFHRHFDDWDAEFGLSTHAHGMYHIEFYTKIRERLKGRQVFLSGMGGDWWAGAIPSHQIDSPEQLVLLGYTHGLRADPTRLRLPVQHELRECFWTEQRERLADHRFQVVTTARLKIMLISYLTRVPRLFGFETWSPYLDIDIAMAMLNLPPERRANRQWQRDFFAKVGLDLESQGLVSTGQNNLDFQALRRIPLRPLDRDLLAEIIDPEYVDWVNREARMTWQGDLRRRLAGVRKVGGALRRVGLGPPPTLQAYCAYLCLRPIETLLARNAG